MAEDKKKKKTQKTPGGFTTKTKYTPGLRKQGESFMDFTTRTHEEAYPGSQRMAREAGAGGWKYFTPAGAEYRRGIREEMPWLKQGQKFYSEDWKRMLANRQAGMYGGDKGTAAQVGGAPPGRPPLPTAMGNVLGGAPRPIPSGVPLPPGGYPGDPRGRAPQRPRTIGAYPGDPRSRRPQISPRGAGTLYDFAPVNYQRPGWSGPARSSLLNRQQVGPPGQFTQPQLHMSDLARMQTGAAARDQSRENAFRATQPTGPTQLQQPQRMSYPGQNYGATGAYLGQFPRYPATPAGPQLPYNVLGGQRRRERQIPRTSAMMNSPYYWGPPRRPISL